MLKEEKTKTNQPSSPSADLKAYKEAFDRRALRQRLVTLSWADNFHIETALDALEHSHSIFSRVSTEAAKVKAIQRLARLNVDRPDWVSEKEWEELHPVEDLGHVVAYCAAMGMNSKEIAKQIRRPETRVRDLLSTPAVEDKVEEIRESYFKQNPRKWMDNILPKAIETAYALMVDESQKGQTRLQAAESFMDRVMGKSTQKIEVEDSTVRDVLRKIDEIEQRAKQPKTIEMKKEGEECQEENQASDPIDAWVAKNPL